MEIQKRAGEAQRKLLKSNREIDGNIPTYAERHKKERWKREVFFGRRAQSFRQETPWETDEAVERRLRPKAKI